MTPLISRDIRRFDPIYGDTRYRVAPRSRPRAMRMSTVFDEAPVSGGDARRFITAFAGGLVFFSILIF